MKKNTGTYFAVVGLILFLIGKFVPFSFAERAIPDLCLIGSIVCFVIYFVLVFKARNANKRQDDDEKNKW